MFETGRRLPLSFEELIGILLEEGWLLQERADDLLRRKDRALAEIVRERRSHEKLSQAMERKLASSITAIELLNHFAPNDASGKPIKEDAVFELFAGKCGLPYLKIDPLKLNGEFITSVISKQFARRHGILPLEEAGGELILAVSNPFNTEAFESIQQAAGKPYSLVITGHSDIQNLITEFYGFRRSITSAEQKLSGTYDLGNLEQFVKMKSDKEIEASDQHVVNAVEYLMNYAFNQRASDIHIEPKRNESWVRFRIDGSLHKVNRLPKLVHNAVVNRIKTLSRLDIGEKRRPQDGRIKTERNDQEYEIRVSTLPVAFGEKVVMRIFDPDIVLSDLAQLGFFKRELDLFEKFIAQPHGIVLVTGPTGSGKTTTLYTALRKLATDEVNITTIEDPIEMVFEPVNQTAVMPNINVTFANALRTLLRQDPDIIMVGEIRDLETAQNAIQASLTGHLVFSTLHTNDAPSAVTRMLDLGVQNFLLSSTLSGVIAQRLVRKICEDCITERVLTEAEVGALGVKFKDPSAPVRTKFGEGCVECRHTGYRGRSAIYEIFEVNKPIQELIMSGSDSGQIKRQARTDGMLTLREAAVKKMLAGITSFEEVISVTREN